MTMVVNADWFSLVALIFVAGHKSLEATIIRETAVTHAIIAKN